MARKEFNIQVNFVVDARDHDEAVEIMKAARRAIAEFEYKARNIESDAEEVR